MILAGRLLVEAAPGVAALREGALRIEGDTIVELLDARAAADVLAHAARHRSTDVLGGPDWLITPGFTDAHVHLPQFDSIGRSGLTLLDWLAGAVFPAEARWADSAFARHMSRRVAHQLIAFGTVGVGAYATVHHDATREAMRALADAGLRGIVGQVLMDREAPLALTRPAAQLLDEAASLAPVGRLRPAVTPRFAIACTPALLEGAGRLAQETGWSIQTHLAETLPECRRVAELFAGSTYLDVYARAGLLRPGAIFAHAIHLADADRRALAGANAVVAHCPTANAFLRSGDMDLAAHLAAGVTCALGSDIAGGYERSMVRVARHALETAARVHPGSPAPGAAWAWWQITAGNADALAPGRLERSPAGRLAVGAPAEVLAIRPDVPWLDSPDPLSTLLYAWDDRWLQRVGVAGRWLDLAARPC